MSEPDQSRKGPSLGWGLIVGVVLTIVGFMGAAGATPNDFLATLMFVGLAILAVTLLLGIVRLIQNLRTRGPMRTN